MDLKESAILGDQVDTHWYYRSKAQALQRYLAGRSRGRILDIGAGSGFFSKWLLRNTDACAAVCVDTGYSRDWDETVAGKPIAYRRAYADGGADLVLLMDVIEHVDDDVGLLVSYREHISTSATWIITVPAFPFLWSGHDVYLEHRRRYTIETLRTRVEAAGLEVDRINYFFGAVFPIAAAIRLAERVHGQNRAAPRSQLQRHGHVMNTVLEGLARLELPLMQLNRLAGLTVFCRCRRSTL
jgi:hypothetical protein